MMRCSYCTKEIEKGTGTMFVRRMGQIKYYCSDRCYKFDVVYHRGQSNKESRRKSKGKGS